MSELVLCGECEAPMKLRQSKYGQFWGCTRYPDCKGTHGAHPDGRPLGKPADKDTKLARIRAHAAFDELWRSGNMKRAEAYARLRQHTGIEHIGECSIEECEQVIEAVGGMSQ